MHVVCPAEERPKVVHVREARQSFEHLADDLGVLAWRLQEGAEAGQSDLALGPQEAEEVLASDLRILVPNVNSLLNRAPHDVSELDLLGACEAEREVVLEAVWIVRN